MSGGFLSVLGLIAVVVLAAVIVIAVIIATACGGILTLGASARFGTVGVVVYFAIWIFAFPVMALISLVVGAYYCLRDGM